MSDPVLSVRPGSKYPNTRRDIENEINFNTDFNVYGSIGTSANRGVAMFINEAVNYKVIDKFTDENGRIVLLNVQIDDAVFFVSMHLCTK